MAPAMATNTTAVHNVRSNRTPAMNERRAPHNTSVGKGFGSGKASWNSNIWGDNKLGNGFAEDQHITDPSYEGKIGSGSLLSTSESDGWSGRPQVPWSTVYPAPSLSFGQHKNVGTSPSQSRSNDRSAPALSEAADTTSYFTLPRSSGIGTSAAGAHKPFLTGDGISPGDSMSFGFSGFKNGDGRRHMNTSAFGGSPMGAGVQMKGGLSGALNTPRSDDMGGMTMSSLAYGVTDMPQPLARAPYSHTSHNSMPFAKRPAHSTAASFHSESQGFDGRHAGPMDISSGLNKLHLNDGGFSAQSAAQRPAFLPHASYDGSYNRLKYNINDDGSFQAVAGYGVETTPDLAFTYPTNKSHVGDFDSIPAPEYTPMASPFYVDNAAAAGLHYRNGSGRLSDGQAVTLERKLRGLQEQDYVQHANPLQRMQLPGSYELAAYQAARYNALAGFYPVGPLGGLGAMVARSHRDQDPSQVVRSPLLEEFRANSKGNKRYELKDIYNHVVEFSGDQHGSRFIQQKLETANSDEKEQVFREIQPNCLQLMTDVFGNYVVQKLFEHGNQTQKKILANQMKGHVLALSTQMYGCRVVQKALEHILTDQQASMVKELESHVLKCVRDQNGNHVIQKAIERVPSHYVQFIINAFKGQVNRLAAHPYGCRVIQRMLEHCEEEDRESILGELHACTATLIPDQFGNYVIQHVIENGEEKDRSRMIHVVMSQLLMFSKHKFASNVVEKSIEFGEESQRRHIIQVLTSPNDRGESPLLGLMRDQYGNYVIQKVLGQLKGAEKDALVEQIKPMLSQLKKFSYGKQIVAIEKLIFDPTSVPNVMHGPSSTTPPNSHKSSPQPSKRPLSSIENCRAPLVGAAPPTPPPTDNQSNAESTVDTKCAKSTVTSVSTPEADASVEVSGT